MKFAIAILIALTTAAHAETVPLCLRMATGEMVPCYSKAKIDAAFVMLKGKYDRDFIISIEINRGTFRDAKALADWIRWGG